MNQLPNVSEPGILLRILINTGLTANVRSFIQNHPGFDMNAPLPGAEGNTPLTLAVTLEDGSIVDTLLQTPRVNVNTPRLPNGNTALMYAAFLEIIR